MTGLAESAKKALSERVGGRSDLESRMLVEEFERAVDEWARSEIKQLEEHMQRWRQTQRYHVSLFSLETTEEVLRYLRGETE